MFGESLGCAVDLRAAGAHLRRQNGLQLSLSHVGIMIENNI
jgi:hypothetical protein